MISKKLHPSRFTEMSPKMAAIVGCIIGERFTNPSLVELSITSDGYVLGRREGDCGLNEWIGSADDLERNWKALIEVANLTVEEVNQAQARYHSVIIDWRKLSFR